MTRFFLIILFSFGCPATLLAQTASQMKNPPMPVTATTGTPNTANTPKISSAPASMAKPLVRTDQANKVNMQNRSIEAGMSAAKERYDQAHSAATNAMATGVVSGTAQIGAAGTGLSRSVNSAAAPISRTGAAKTNTNNILNGASAKKTNANNQEVNANKLQAEADKADQAKKSSSDRVIQARSSIQKMLDTQRQMQPCPTC